MTTTTKRVFVFDIDGTLLGPMDTRLGHDAIKAVQMARYYGDIIFASARPLKGIRYLYDESDLKINHIIALNGTLTIRNNSFFASHHLDNDTVNYFLTRKKAFNNLWLFTETEWYSGNIQSKVYLDEKKSVSFEAKPLEEYNGEAVCKITIFEDASALKAIEELRAGINLPGIAKSCSSYIEIYSNETDKYLAIERLYSGTEIVLFSFGDSDNDLKLLKHSYFGCAVANATPQIKLTANYVSKFKYGTGVLDCISHIISKL